MTDEDKSEIFLGTVDPESVQSKASLVEKAKKIGFTSAEIAELRRLYPDLKRITSHALPRCPQWSASMPTSLA